MADARFAIIDPAAGISGDMLLGALVAAGAQRAWLEALPARLGFPEVSIRFSEVDRGGLRALKVDVVLPGGVTEQPGDVTAAESLLHHAHRHSHPFEHDHSHQHNEAPDDHTHPHLHGDGHHRHVGELIDIIERAPLSPWVRERAVRALRLVGAAEGQVHGQPADEVALHEVGALDALVDLVGGIEGFEQLGIRRIYHRPVAVGDGWVRAAHGVMPVPAPATALLLEGLAIGPNGPVHGEATTPTGAALLRVLSEGEPPARWRPIGAHAWGAGTRNPPGYANALRLIVAEAVQEAAEVVVLATDLDDLSPEYLDPLRDALVAAGALDVQIWGTQMKKGRPGFRVEVIAPPERVDAVTDAFLRHSTTAGLRRYRVERVTLPRREVMVEGANGKQIRVKVLDAPGGPRAKPEYEDVAELARQTGRPAHEVARDLQNTALRSIGAIDVHESGA